MNREAAYIDYYEMHREAYSYRPSREDMVRLKSLSDEALEAEIARVGNAANAAVEAENAVFERNFEKFVAYITTLMAENSISKETALRWDMAAMEADDFSHYCYLWDMTQYDALSFTKGH